MEREVEDISSEKVKGEIKALETLETRTLWMRGVTLLGGTVCSFWVIYRVFAARGFVLAFVVFLGLSFIYTFGLPPLLAVASSPLCFFFNVVGIWLPILSYILAATLLYVDLKRDNLRRRVVPYNLGSIHGPS